MLDRARALRSARPLPTAAAAGAVTPELAAQEGPPVETLLEVDREYRDGAEAGRLPTIAPRRFNPEGKAWLPVLHAKHGDWHFTALFSNTARAHELGRVHDWVVIYAEDRDHHERQYTVVTPPGGPLAGRRVVRGREAECRAWYASH
jgi:putative hydrolase